MKLYIWKHKGANRPINFYPLSKAETIGKGVMRPIAVHAFFTKRDAKEYMKTLSWGECTEYYEIISIDLKPAS